LLSSALTSSILQLPAFKDVNSKSRRDELDSVFFRELRALCGENQRHRRLKSARDDKEKNASTRR
jgi:hypothetical protein